MNSYMKYGLLLFFYISSFKNVHANPIDSLTSKNDVQKFLIANLSKSGVVFLNQCADIWQAEKIKPAKYVRDSIIDTVTIVDPETRKESKKVIKHERIQLPDCSPDTNNSPLHYPYDKLAQVMDRYPWHLHKADIDHNGFTDLVVDAGIVIIVMDMGGKFEGHLFSDSPDLGSYSFKNFLSLQDNSTALLFRHDYNRCDDTMDIRLFNVVDTIVYKFHGFAKYSHFFKPIGISKIDYYYHSSSTERCADRYDCIEINKNGQCFMQYLGGFTHNLKDRAIFSGTIDTVRLHELWNLVSYVDIKSKKDIYACWIDHSSGGTFAIYFDDGSTKKITTWAYCPLMDLGYLSKKISDISRIIQWQPSKKHYGFECPCILSSELNYNLNGCECR